MFIGCIEYPKEIAELSNLTFLCLFNAASACCDLVGVCYLDDFGAVYLSKLWAKSQPVEKIIANYLKFDQK